MDRDEIVPQHNGAVFKGGVHTHVLESAETEQVREARAHVRHRQRLPSERLDDLCQHGLGGLASFDSEVHGRHGAAEEVGHCSERRQLSPTEDTQDTEDQSFRKRSNFLSTLSSMVESW